MHAERPVYGISEHARPHTSVPSAQELGAPPRQSMLHDAPGHAIEQDADEPQNTSQLPDGQSKSQLELSSHRALPSPASETSHHASFLHATCAPRPCPTKQIVPSHVSVESVPIPLTRQ